MNFSKILNWIFGIMAFIGVFLIIGAVGASDYAVEMGIYEPLTAHLKEEIHTSEQSSTETLVYGAYDERCFTEEISLDWGVGDLDFKPLDCKMPEEQQEFVYYLCSGYNLDFTLVMALIQHESSFDPNVISNTNDYGYMQINAINHDWLTETIGVTDYTDPSQVKFLL